MQCREQGIAFLSVAVADFARMNWSGHLNTILCQDIHPPLDPLGTVPLTFQRLSGSPTCPVNHHTVTFATGSCSKRAEVGCVSCLPSFEKFDRRELSSPTSELNRKLDAIDEVTGCDIYEPMILSHNLCSLNANEGRLRQLKTC